MDCLISGKKVSSKFLNF